MRHTRFVPLLALGLILAGCAESSTAPVLGQGTFVLRSVAGESLPTRVRVDQFGGDYLADTLRFEPMSLALFSGPTLERSIVERLQNGDTVRQVELVAYRREGDDFQFSYPCDDDTTDCLVGFVTGSLVGDRLEVAAHPNSGLRSPLVYERIR